MEIAADGHHHSALGRGVVFGQDHRIHAHRLLEGLGLPHGVLPGGGVDHQHLPVGGLGLQPGPDDLVDLAQLLHELGLVVQAPGGVGQHQVGSPGPGAGDGVEDHRAGVGPRRLPHDRHLQALAPQGQLVDRRGPEGVAGGQQHLAAAAAVPGGQLGDGRGLAHPVHSQDQEKVERPRDELQGLEAQGGGQQALEGGQEAVPVPAAGDLLPQPFQQAIRGRGAQIGLQQYVAQLREELLVARRPAEQLAQPGPESLQSQLPSRAYPRRSAERT
jgi:hypothetical protein